MTPLSFTAMGYALERVSPVQEHIDPVPSLTSSAICRGVLAYAKIMGSLVTGVVQVRCVVPEPARAYAHPRRHEVPQIELSKQNAVAVELRKVAPCARNPSRSVTADRLVHSLKVCAHKN